MSKDSGPVIGVRAWAVCLEEALRDDICVGRRKRQKQRILIALPDPPPIFSNPVPWQADCKCLSLCLSAALPTSGVEARGESAPSGVHLSQLQLHRTNISQSLRLPYELCLFVTMQLAVPPKIAILMLPLNKVSLVLKLEKNIMSMV